MRAKAGPQQAARSSLTVATIQTGRRDLLVNVGPLEPGQLGESVRRRPLAIEQHATGCQGGQRPQSGDNGQFTRRISGTKVDIVTALGVVARVKVGAFTPDK